MKMIKCNWCGDAVTVEEYREHVNACHKKGPVLQVEIKDKLKIVDRSVSALEQNRIVHGEREVLSYVVAKGDTTQDLAEAVNSKIKTGYVPHGSMVMAVATADGFMPTWRFAQGMVEYEDKEAEFFYECSCCGGVYDDRHGEPTTEPPRHDSSDGLGRIMCPKCVYSEALSQMNFKHNALVKMVEANVRYMENIGPAAKTHSTVCESLKTALEENERL